MESEQREDKRANEPLAQELCDKNDVVEVTPQQSTETVTVGDIHIKPETAIKNKRVSFKFGACSNDSKGVVLNTIQNIYDKKGIPAKEDIPPLVCSNSSKSRIDKSAYVKLHRHTVSSVGSSTVDKLKGRYENAVKPTDNDLKVNTGVPVKANIDNNSANNLKNANGDNEKVDEENGNFQSNLYSLKTETNQSEKSKSTITAKQTEKLISKTTSNIEKLQSTLSTKLSSDTIEKLRSKYSPASFGYPKPTVSSKKVQFSENLPTRIPVPTPRTSITIPEKEKKVNFDSLELDDKDSKKEEIQTVTIKLVSLPEAPSVPVTSQSDSSVNKDASSTTSQISTETKSVTAPLDKGNLKLPLSTLNKAKSPIQTSTNEETQFEKNTETEPVEIQVNYDTIEFAEPEEKHFIVRRSSSEDSVDKVESFFSEIVMEKKGKEKKRSNSFKKILTGGFFGRERKKSDDDKTKPKKKDNTVSADNAQNESQAFDRNSSFRHTTDNSFPRPNTFKKNVYQSSPPPRYYSPQTQFGHSTEHRYTEMNGSQFVSNKHNKYSPEEYVPMNNGNVCLFEDPRGTYININKYSDNSSSSNTMESDRNCTYQNALIAQVEMRQILENENEYRNSPRSNIPLSINKPTSPVHRALNRHDSESSELLRDSILHSQNASENVQLVKPKAVIPINSERPLPNPYHSKDKQVNYENIQQGETLSRNLNFDNSKPYPQKTNMYGKTTPQKTSTPVIVEDVYGTVFDSITPQQPPELPLRNNENFRNTTKNYGYTTNQSVAPNRYSPDKNEESTGYYNRRKIGSPLLSVSNYNKDSSGTVRLSLQNNFRADGNAYISSTPKKPMSPKSLEGSKLKLPIKREKVDLQPRLRSPIPQAKPSTDKIIATELLRNKKSPTRVSPQEKLLSNRESDSYENNLNSLENLTLNTQFTCHDHNRLGVYLNSPAASSNKSPSPRGVPADRFLEAAQWQKQQRDLDKSPALESSTQVTTDVMVHVDSKPVHGSYNYRNSPPSLYGHRNISSPVSNSRPQTPLRPIPSSPNRSPEKQQIFHNVEAFYWRELKKLKDKEEYELDKYRQKQMYVYGYVEDPGFARRSRSVSPSVQRGRRSLSLPREVRPLPGQTALVPEAIPEHRPVIAKKPIALPTNSVYNRNPHFIRNSFERSTIGPIGTNSRPFYENSSPKPRQPNYAPIFKRGSLTASRTPDFQQVGSKRVSFSGSQNSDAVSWPTKNGFTKSPPTRRIDREMSLEDDVFLPASPRSPQNIKIEESRRLYDANTLHYAERIRSLRSERDDVDKSYPKFRGSTEPIYERKDGKRITVSNKVCDIYGQIYETGEQIPSYGQITQKGVVYGHVQPNINAVHRQSFNQLHAPSNFVRGTRLTASVNDMHKRYPPEFRIDNDTHLRNSGFNQSPVLYRPLPPVPENRDSRTIMSKKIGRVYVPVSDTESGSEAGEVQRILQSGTRHTNFGVIEEEWNSDGKSGRTSGNESGGSRGENEGEIKSGRSRSARREDPRRHTLSGDQHYTMAGQGGPLSRTMDLEGQFPRGYPPSSNAMLFDDDPGIMSEVETSSTGFRRGGKQRSSLPVVRTPSKTLERPLGLVFLQYRNETKRALLPNEITSIDTVKALFVRSFPKQLSMEYLDSPLVKIYIHDSSKDMFYELEDVRYESHLREIRDRSVLRLFESTDVSGGLPMGGVGIPGGVGHFEDPSYFSEPEFDSEYQHQHIHKSKGSASKGAPYYMGSTSSLPRGGPLLRPYSPAVTSLPPDRMKTLPAGAPPKPQRAYSSGATRSSDGSSRPSDRFAPFQRPANPLFNLPDGYMSSPERGSRGYEDPYYSQYTSRSGSITPVIDEEVSDTELLDEQYSLYGVKLPPGGPRGARSQFPGPPAVPYDATRLRVEHMERQLANLTGLVQKALTQTPTPRDFLAPPGRDSYRSGDEFDKNSSSSSASLPDDAYLRSDSNKAPKLGKTSCHKSVSFEKSVSFSDEPPDMNSPKQHSPQHTADTKPPKPAIKSSTLPRTSSQEKDRLKPAPPPKPASLSPGQYDGRHIYRDLQLTPEMYNQLRGLQKKAKDLKSEVRNLRRMSQAQAHSVRETIRDAFIKIRAMLMAGGEQVWQAGMDQERVRLSRDEDSYKQEMLRLEKDLTDLEASVEELRGNVINRKTRVNMSDVENMALVLSKSSKTVADLKLRFPGLQDSMKSFLGAEMDKMVREEKFLKEEPERLESALRRCKKLTGTLVTLKRLASVQEQRLPCSTSATDGRISPSITETPPVTPTSAQHGKPPSGARVGQIGLGGDGTNASDSNQRPENALDALLDELQTFAKPHSTTVNTQMPQASYSDSTPSDPPAIPVKGIPPSHSAHFGYPPPSEINRKGSMDSASILPTQNLTVSTATGSLRRLHSYPSGSDTDNSPPIQPLKQLDGKAFNKPPIPERNAELLQHIASGRRVPPPPPPRTSSKSPLASPTSPSLPPRSPATGLQHIQNVQNMTEKPQSQFEVATQNLGLSTLRRNVPNKSNIKDNSKAQTLPRNIGSNLQVHSQTVASGELQNVSSSSCESVNSQDGSKKGSRKEELEQRHQELLKKQKALQEQYARLQQLQRGNNTLAVVPPAPDQLLKKTGSESNLLHKMGLQMATTQMTGSLTHLPSTTTASTTTSTNTTDTVSTNSSQPPVCTTTVTSTIADTNTTDSSSSSSTTTTTTTNKVYETDIL